VLLHTMNTYTIGPMPAQISTYQMRMVRYADDLSQADYYQRISYIEQPHTQDTRSMQTDMQRNYDELESARRHAAVHEEKIRVLEQELESDRKSTRLNSSHVKISYAVFCLKKKST